MNNGGRQHLLNILATFDDNNNTKEKEKDNNNTDSQTETQTDIFETMIYHNVKKILYC